MRIKTRIKLGIILSLVLASIIALLLFFSARGLNEASKLEGIAVEIIKGVAEIKIVTHEYILHPEERSLMQWRSRYSSLSKLLTGSHFKNPDEKIAADQIFKNLERFKTVFYALITGLKKGETPGNQESAAFRKLQDRLMDELLMKSRLAVSLAFQLQQKIEAKLMTTQKRVSFLTLLLLLALTAAITGISLWVNRSIARPIAKLEKGTQIIGSGNLDHEVGITAKDEIGELSRAFDKMTQDLKETTTSIVELNKEINERKRAEEALRASEEKYRTILESIEDGYFEVDIAGNFTFFNDSLCEMFRYSKDELMGMNNRQYTDEESAKKLYQTFNTVYTTGKSDKGFDWEIIRKDGTKIVVEASISLRSDAGGEPIGFRGIVRDIFEKKRLESQLQQAQKMEAIATLAGGVAHEFNNTLMGIMGNIELLKMNFSEDGGIDKHLESMKSAGHRMSRLTDQLLAYAEGGKYQPKNLRLDDFVIQTLPILQHDLSPQVRVETHFQKDISHINADNAQMQMVLSALLANANEAIEDKGIIRITAENKDLDEDFTKQHPGLQPGSYVCLTIEDDGEGMDEEIKDGIFEPFFTTKFQGRGMGMAAVHGIVKNHDGWIYVDSELGKGTTVRIYFPAVEVEIEKPKEAKAEIAAGSGTILMIEDEEVVVEVTQAMLEMLGYRVMVAKTGKDAIHITETVDGQIDLALLDIKLPDIDGRKLYPLIMKARSNLKVIVCSGYSIDGPAREILDAGAQDFIQKPFSIAKLSEKLKKVSEG